MDILAFFSEESHVLQIRCGITGRGLYAIRRIKCGDTIFVDKLMKVQHSKDLKESLPAYLKLAEQVKALNLDDPIDGLHVSGFFTTRVKFDIPDADPRTRQCLDILISNCVVHVLNDKQAETILAPKCSYINHSCRANCVFLPSGHLIAARDIYPDDELTLSYYCGQANGLNVVDLAVPTELRRAKIAECFGFTCLCALCLSNFFEAPLENRIYDCADLVVTRLSDTPLRQRIDLCANIPTREDTDRRPTYVLSTDTMALLEEVVQSDSKSLSIGLNAHAQYGRNRKLFRHPPPAKKSTVPTDEAQKDRHPPIDFDIAMAAVAVCGYLRGEKTASDRAAKTAALIIERNKERSTSWMYTLAQLCLIRIEKPSHDYASYIRRSRSWLIYLKERHANLSVHKVDEHVAFMRTMFQTMPTAKDEIARLLGLSMLREIDPSVAHLHILLQTPLYILLVDCADLSVLCGLCHQKAAQKCAVCKKIGYCSKPHQAAHWKLHRRQCAPP